MRRALLISALAGALLAGLAGLRTLRGRSPPPCPRRPPLGRPAFPFPSYFRLTENRHPFTIEGR